jgi:hypothetical protein
MSDEVGITNHRADARQNESLIGTTHMARTPSGTQRSCGSTAASRSSCDCGFATQQLQQLSHLHYEAARDPGIPRAQIHTLTAGCETDLHSEAEQAALRYAEALTRGPIRMLARRSSASTTGSRSTSSPRRSSRWSMSRLETPDPDGAPVFYAALFGWTTEASDIGETRITVFHLPGYVGGEPEQASSPPLSMDRTVSRRRPTETALGRHAAALGQSAGVRPNPGALRLEFGAGRGPARRTAAGCRRHLATATADLEFIPPGELEITFALCRRRLNTDPFSPVEI